MWVDIDPGLFDPDVIADCYERYIDQLVYAEECGFDGICINEHHGNGYGLMPSPNVIGSVLATRTSRAAITVLGNSVALYNPPVRVAEEMAMLDLLSRGRLISGFPVGTSMDTAYAYSVNPGNLREKYYEGIELDPAGVDGHRAVRLQRPVHPDRYVNVLPRPLQRPHPPIWIPGGGSVETWDYCADARLRLRRALLLRPPHGQGDRRGLLAPGRGARQGPQPLPAGLPPVHRRRRHRPGGLPALQGAGRVLLQPLAPRVPRLHRSARLRHRGVGAGPLQVARCAPWPGPSRPSTT